MFPVIHTSYFAIIIAALVSVGFCWLWHYAICGTKLAAICEIHKEHDKKHCRKATILSFVGALLTAYVLYSIVHVWRPSSWGMMGMDKAFHYYGFCAGFFVWLGFYVPTILNATLWMKKSWAFFGTKCVYHFINLQLMALILAYWHYA